MPVRILCIMQLRMNKNLGILYGNKIFSNKKDDEILRTFIGEDTER